MSLLANLFSLAGKTAIITGATGGIGLKLTTALAEAGCTTIVSIQLPNDPNASSLQSSITDIESARVKSGGDGLQLKVYECNIMDSTALRAVFANMWADGVVPDILLNCAGVNRRKPVTEVTDDDIEFVWGVNLRASFVCAQEVGRQLLSLNRPGKIINIASVIGHVGNFNVSAYAASKGGVLQMTRAFSNEWAGKGIQVNAISPGYIQTELTTPLTEDPVFNSYIIDRTPAGRWGLADDLQGAVIYLASPASGWVTGISLNVDGGFLSK